MSFHFPSDHHNAGGWSPRPSIPSSANGSVNRMGREQAQQTLEFLRKNDISQTRKADQIQPGLYLGDLTSARDLHDLETKKITHVLSVCHCPDLIYPPSMSIKHKVLDVDDARDEDLLDHFKDCWRFIRDVLDEGGRIMVHCQQGISRSPTVVAAYLMRADRLHPVSALKAIKRFRPIIEPNEGFREQLDVWGNCRGELAGQADYVEWKRKMDHRRKV